MKTYIALSFLSTCARRYWEIETCCACRKGTRRPCDGAELAISLQNRGDGEARFVVHTLVCFCLTDSDSAPRTVGVNSELFIIRVCVPDGSGSWAIPAEQCMR
jgi:hypothetical protein